MQFQILDAADPHGRKIWADFWAQWPGREIFAHPDYVRLYAGPCDRALCAAASVGRSNVLYPFLLRALGSEPYCDPSLQACTDIATPYGYGGPFGWGNAMSSEDNREFWEAFDAWAEESGVVSEIVRLSLFPETLVEYPGERRIIQDNVVRVLLGETEVWRDFEYKVRKNVNKARANGVRVQIDETGCRFDDFNAIYTSTMDRRGAAEHYYFSREYFERIREDLKGQFAYFHALVGDAVVSTELVLVSADRVYSFLGGTDAAWFHVRPNELLKVEIMNWARRAGKREFVLGGGYGRGDGIYRYKLSFAPCGCAPFSIGCRIFNRAAYEQLVNSRRAFETLRGNQWQPNPEFFPAYRG